MICGCDEDVLTTGLHSNELQLNAFDGHLRVLHHQLPNQRFSDHTVCGSQVTPDQEPRKQTPLDERKRKTRSLPLMLRNTAWYISLTTCVRTHLVDVLQGLWSNGEVHRRGHQLCFLWLSVITHHTSHNESNHILTYHSLILTNKTVDAFHFPNENPFLFCPKKKRKELIHTLYSYQSTCMNILLCPATPVVRLCCK